MSDNASRRKKLLAIVVLMILLAMVIALALTRCQPTRKPAPANDTTAAPTSSVAQQPTASGAAPDATQPAEVLTPATLMIPESVSAGAAFAFTWSGPDNRGDYVTIIRADAPADQYGSYQNTEQGPDLQLTAPIEPGTYEVRYVTARSHTILGRAAIEVTPIGATLDTPVEVILGAAFTVTWTGPNNQGDYITIVASGTPDAKYGNYTNTSAGSPLTITAPPDVGDAEVRYVSGQGKQVLARRPIRVIAADVALDAPDEVIAGSSVPVTWSGPNNSGDYLTVVAAEIPDGQFGNYTNTSAGSPLNLLMPIMAGKAEIRYVTGQGARVLARRPITIVAAVVMLAAPAQGAAGSTVSITWTGPNNSGDYITIVAKDAADGHFGDYTATASGSPLNVKMPKDPGEAEIRYMTGQGGKVLARIPITVVP